MKQLPTGKERSAEEVLLAALREVDARIASAQHEKDALTRQLIRLRASDARTGYLGRKNSVDRMIAEQIILDRLRTLGKDMQTRPLYDATKADLPSLQYGTFRTYLYRMKERGFIASPRRGVWGISS